MCTFSGSKGSGDITGTVSISQSSASEAAVFSLDLSGLTPNMMHGFHVHENGDLSDNCKGAGGHYNPYNVRMIILKRKNIIDFFVCRKIMEGRSPLSDTWVTWATLRLMPAARSR